MNPRSIRARLTFWYATVLAATFAVAGSGVWWTMRGSIHETIDKELRTRSIAIRTYLARHAKDPHFESLTEELTEQSEMAPAAIGYRVASASGRWVYASPGTESWPEAPPAVRALPPGGVIENIGAARRPYRVLTAALPEGLVQIGLPLREYYEMLDHFTWTALLASPVLLLLASLGGYWMSRRALAAVDRITNAAAGIEEQNLTQRLPLSGTGDELDHLSATLNQMLDRLERSFARMARFTADASHELRTPVAIIRMNAEVTLAKPRAPEQYREALERILAETGRTTTLIEDLMTLARADADAAELVREPVGLAAVIGARCAEIGVLADAASVKLIVELPVECQVLGDATMLDRLFLILLDNAIRYTPPAGTITVALACEAEHRSAVVTIRDTGIGIAPEDLPHVFERFYRAAKDRSRETGGAGLGLAIALWIARRHAGTLTVRSAPGEGSEFQLRLPLA